MNTNPIIQHIKNMLEQHVDPITGKTLEADRIKALRFEGGVVKFVLEFQNKSEAQKFEVIRLKLVQEISHLDGVSDVQIASAILPPSVQAPNIKPPHPVHEASKKNRVRRIYAIASGKGGVGKSTVSSNLAVALAMQGKAVGLLDADIYGPSQVMMMGVHSKPESQGSTIIPTVAHGVKMVSMGQLLPDGEAVIWRGPMLMKALDQLLNQVAWGDLDVLLIDLPPGTGDVQISLAQRAALSGVMIVTTPQDVALIDARRAISMFGKLNIPIIGLIENMATHICTHCGHEEPIFGSGGAKDEAEKRGIPYLGALALAIDIRMSGDAGRPIALAGGTLFNALAARLVAGEMV